MITNIHVDHRLKLWSKLLDCRDYSLVKLFPRNPVLYTYMFPWLWYPLKNIVMTWTIFLTMGLSTERYLAVCRPILYRTLGSVSAQTSHFI